MIFEAERDMFVTLTRNNFFDVKNDDAAKLNKETKERFDTILAQQQDANFLKSQFLPAVKKDQTYQAPTAQGYSHKHENMYVITNTEHSKTTNNGYKRGTAGAFFCH